MWPWAVAWLWLGAAAAQPPALPHCKHSQGVATNLLYVSTLDGEVAAIDTTVGTKKWNFQTGPPLLSSSIHRLELSNGGQWMRLVPSLSGSLYKFSGDNLEPLPITADQLLSSSFKYSDDLVIAGAKETISFGVSSATGNVIYECSVTGCVNTSEIIKKNGLYNDSPAIDDAGDVLLIRRVTQTVRAFEPSTGHEKWNFSVGQHELIIPPHDGCIMQDSTPQEKPNADLIFKVIVPEGLVCAMDKNAPHKILWQYKLNSPIVGAWKVEQSKLKPIDLFGIPHLPYQNKNYQSFITPSVYIGMHDRQLYIQESVRMQAMVQASSRQYLGSQRYKDPIVLPWHPLPAKALAEWSSDSTALSSLTDKDHTTTAISILYASEYVNGNGFYLYTEADRRINYDRNCHKGGYKILNAFYGLIEKYKNIPRETLQIDHTTTEWSNNENITILVVSLWYYWKEVALIVIASLIFYNIFCNKYRNVQPQNIIHRVIVERVDSTTKPINNIEIPTEIISSPVDTPPTPFVSRYLNDFTPIKCLGRGGFGIVFEARNNIDEANYAVKRITLPNTKEKRERVLREVRALAKLEHGHIVRYFNSWLEEPPPDWEDPYEKNFIKDEDYTETYSELPSNSHVVSNSKSKILEKMKSIAKSPYESVDTGYGAFPEVSVRPRSFSVNDSCSVIFANDPEQKSSSYCVIDTSRNKDHKISFYIDSNSNMDEVDGNVSSSKDNVECNTSMSDIVFQPDACEIVDESVKNKHGKKHRRNLSLDLRKTRYEKDRNQSCGKMYLYIQMQLCQEKSLREWLKENDDVALRRAQIIKMFDQIVSAVEYVHMQGLIHRDLKPSNIFFSTDGLIKVGDFGLVTTMADPLSSEGNRSSIGPFEYGKEKHTQHVGTHLYMSPEQLRGEPHNFKVDIWSLGLVLLELLVPFNTEMERIGVLKLVRDSRFPDKFETNYPDEHSLLAIMLSPDPNSRPSTFGIRARPPLSQETDPRFHFSLPLRLPRSSTNSFSIS